jgi:hypothetical protein
MSFFKKLVTLFSGSSAIPTESYWIEARCNRCGETLRTRVDLQHDLSADYDIEAGETGYFCRKLLSGDGKNLCFQTIEVTLRFNGSRQIISREISGGMFSDEATSG